MATIELLESRIAPATISLTYTDADGDLVKITASRMGEVMPGLSADDLVFTDGDPDGQLLSLTITESTFTDANISFSVKRKAGGDGLAHVGFINATGIDLNKVTVKGDLGRILAGDQTTADDAGLNVLTVRSMGTLGLTTQGDSGDLKTVIQGRLGALKVAKDLVDAMVQATATVPANGEIGSVFIGGNLTGGEGFSSGVVSSSGEIGPVFIGGNLTGGGGISSGVISSSGAMGEVHVIGGIIRGTGLASGAISSGSALGDVRIGRDLSGAVSCTGPLGDIRVGGDVEGSITSGGGIESVRIKGDLAAGEEAGTGRIFSSNAIGRIRIGGSVTVGAGSNVGSILSQTLIDRIEIKRDLAGTVDCFGSIGRIIIGGDVIGTASKTGVITGADMVITIGGDLRGGSITGSDSLLDSGAIIGSMRSVTIKGSIIAGTDDSTGVIQRSAGIFSGNSIETVKVGGSLVGNEFATVQIVAQRQSTKPTEGFDVAIGSVTIGHDVQFAHILAGFNEFGSPVNADASIGKVIVGGHWEASSIVAGAQDTGAPGFGIGDSLQAVDNTALVARIESITIKRTVTGSTAIGDHFGFVAQQIDKLKIGIRPTVLNSGPSNDDLAIGLSDDMRLLEVS